MAGLVPCPGRCGLTRRRRDADVEVRDLAQFGERRLNLRAVAYDQDGKFRHVDVLVGDSGDVGGGDLCRYAVALYLLQEVQRIAVEGERDLLVIRPFFPACRS